MHPKISIVTPVRNGGSHIARTLKSVFCQDEPSFEILIIDDGSVDETEKIVRQWQDSRIRYSKLNGKSGANAARNEGTSLARSETVTYLDADDELMPFALSNRLSTLQRSSDCSVVLSSFKAVKKKHTVTRANSGGVMSPMQVQIALLTYKLHIAGTAITARKSALQQIDGWNEQLRRLQDRDVLLRLATAGNCITIAEEDWIKHDVPGSISGSDKMYMQALARFVESNSEVAKQHRHLIAGRVSQRIIVNALRGRLSQALSDYRDNMREPELGFSAWELLRANVFGRD